MRFMVIPQAWITPAILAAAMHFGPIPADNVKIKYRHLPGNGAGHAKPPGTIIMDKRPSWNKEQAQCVLVHEYGHLSGRKHTENKRSIMHHTLYYRTCHRWLVRHGVD